MHGRGWCEQVRMANWRVELIAVRNLQAGLFGSSLGLNFWQETSSLRLA